MTNLPTGFRVDIEFEAGTWTEVTADVLARPSVHVEYGRTSPFSTPQVATASLTLNNTSGKYTPKNPDSPYYPNVKPRRRLRITYTSGASAVYLGYAKSFTPALRRGIMPVVAVAAVDRMSALQDKNLDSIVREQYLSTGPAFYLPLADPEGSATVATFDGAASFPILGKGSGSITGTITFGTEPPHPWDQGSWATFAAGASDANGRVISVPTVNSSDWSIALAFRSSVASTNNLVLWMQEATSTPSLASYIRVDGLLGQLTAAVQCGGTVYTVATSPLGPDLIDGQPHVVVLTAAAATGLVCYLDGVSIGAISNIADPGTTVASIGGSIDTAAALGGYWTGDLAHFATWQDRTLTAGEAADLSEAILTGFAGDKTGERIDRLASYAGLTVADLNTAIGQEFCAPQLTQGRDLVDLWDELVTTEAGGAAMYVDTDGRLRFDDRSWRTPHTSPVLTIDASTDVLPDEWQPFYDDWILTNDSTVTTSHGPTARYVDADSVDEDGSVTDAVTTLALSATAAHLLAQYRVNASRSELRFPRLKVNVAAIPAAHATAIYAALPSMTIGSRIRIVNIPKSKTNTTGGTTRIFHTDRLDVYVEGWSIDHGADEFSITWDLSAADVPARGVWDDTIFGHWQAPEGSMTVTSDIDDSDTTLSITTATGYATLTTSPGNYPLELKLDEEVVSITDPPLCVGNLLSAENASFEGGTTGTAWFGSVISYTAATIANSSTRAQAGTKSLLVTWPTAGAGASTAALSLTGLDVGRWYTLSAYVWVPASNPAVRLSDLYGVFFAVAPDGYVSTSTVTASWQRLAVRFQATASSGYLGIVNDAAATSGQQVWVDAVMLSEGRSVQAFTTTAPPVDHGASSPQIVTIARAQEGTFADAHAAGTPIDLHPAATWVL